MMMIIKLIAFNTNAMIYKVWLAHEHSVKWKRYFQKHKECLKLIFGNKIR